MQVILGNLNGFIWDVTRLRVKARGQQTFWKCGANSQRLQANSLKLFKPNATYMSKPIPLSQSMGVKKSWTSNTIVFDKAKFIYSFPFLLPFLLFFVFIILFLEVKYFFLTMKMAMETNFERLTTPLQQLITITPLSITRDPIYKQKRTNPLTHQLSQTIPPKDFKY